MWLKMEWRGFSLWFHLPTGRFGFHLLSQSHLGAKNRKCGCCGNSIQMENNVVVVKKHCSNFMLWQMQSMFEAVGNMFLKSSLALVVPSHPLA